MTVQRTHAAPLVVGQLVRVTNQHSGFVGMTGRIVAEDAFLRGIYDVRMTATGNVMSFGAVELTLVEGRTNAGKCYNDGNGASARNTHAAPDHSS